MSVFLRDLTVPERALNAGDNGPFDLPVNPVSYMLLHVRAEAGVSPPDFNQLLGHLTSISVTFKGTQIIQMSGVDLARAVHHLWGRALDIENYGAVSPALVSFTLPIPFGRMPMGMKEAFPATRRGEFSITITRSQALTNITNPVFALEGMQLLEADPGQFTKMVTLSKNIVAGDSDFELPIGNPFLALQIFSPTAMGNAPISESVRRTRLLFDNVEYDYSDTAFDVLRNDGWLRGSDFNDYAAVSSLIRNYALMDFDPMRDDNYMIETEGRASVRLRFVPDLGGLVRVTPIELVRLPGAAAA